ncbi:MAG: type III secretion system export apparatus subunit SctU [Gammaproteobacteria bacterium]
MSESSGDKTEQPTAKRLRDARKKGQVAKSKDVSSAAVIVPIMLFLWAGSDYFFGKFKQLIEQPIWIEGVNFQKAYNVVIEQVFYLFLLVVTPVVGIAALAALFAGYLQVGGLFAPEAVKPDLKKMDPIEALKNIFSKKNTVTMLISMLKIIIMTYLVYSITKKYLPSLSVIPYCGMECIFPVLGDIMWQLIKYASVAFIAVAVADYAYQRHEYIKNLKMSKDEVKREFKESEGSPEIKGKRRQLFSEIVNSQQQANVKRSTCIVSNPTHVAIGLYYDEGNTPLPIITLKEQGLNALNIIRMAEQEGIPVMQDVPLAHSLLEEGLLDNYLPSTLIAPVAEVLRVVHDLR